MAKNVRHTFTPAERLKSRTEINRLFAGQSQSFGQYPLRLVWQPMEERRSEAPVQLAISVPKKRFKTAVARNRLRRRIREAYRLHKHRLYRGLPADGQQYAWMIIYTAQEEMEYVEIEAAMQRVIGRFLKYAVPRS